MSRSMPAPWLLTTISDILGNVENSGGKNKNILAPRVVQVIAVSENTKTIVINDKEFSANVFLTQNCYDDICKDYSLSDLKYSQIKIEKYHFSTVLQSCSQFNLETLHNQGISFPLILQCSKLSYLGANDCAVIGEPKDMNKDRRVGNIILNYKYIEMVKKLALKQFPNIKRLPNHEGGHFQLQDFDSRPPAPEFCIIPPQQSEALAAIILGSELDRAAAVGEDIGSPASLSRRSVHSTGKSPKTPAEQQADIAAFSSQQVLLYGDKWAEREEQQQQQQEYQHHAKKSPLFRVESEDEASVVHDSGGYFETDDEDGDGEQAVLVDEYDEVSSSPGNAATKSPGSASTTAVHSTVSTTRQTRSQQQSQQSQQTGSQLRAAGRKGHNSSSSSSSSSAVTIAAPESPSKRRRVEITVQSPVNGKRSRTLSAHSAAVLPVDKVVRANSNGDGRENNSSNDNDSHGALLPPRGTSSSQSFRSKKQADLYKKLLPTANALLTQSQMSQLSQQQSQSQSQWGGEESQSYQSQQVGFDDSLNLHTQLPDAASQSHDGQGGESSGLDGLDGVAFSQMWNTQSISQDDIRELEEWLATRYEPFLSPVNLPAVGENAATLTATQLSQDTVHSSSSGQSAVSGLSAGSAVSAVSAVSASNPQNASNISDLTMSPAGKTSQRPSNELRSANKDDESTVSKRSQSGAKSRDHQTENDVLSTAGAVIDNGAVQNSVGSAVLSVKTRHSAKNSATKVAAATQSPSAAHLQSQPSQHGQSDSFSYNSQVISPLNTQPPSQSQTVLVNDNKGVSNDIVTRRSTRSTAAAEVTTQVALIPATRSGRRYASELVTIAEMPINTSQASHFSPSTVSHTVDTRRSSSRIASATKASSSSATSASEEKDSVQSSASSKDEEEEEEEVDPDDGKEIGETHLIGRNVRKYFKGHGMFNGVVKSYSRKSRFYLVEYSDGDSEEIMETQVRALLASRLCSPPGKPSAAFRNNEETQLDDEVLTQPQFGATTQDDEEEQEEEDRLSSLPVIDRHKSMAKASTPLISSSTPSVSRGAGSPDSVLEYKRRVDALLAESPCSTTSSNAGTGGKRPRTETVDRRRSEGSSSSHAAHVPVTLQQEGAFVSRLLHSESGLTEEQQRSLKFTFAVNSQRNSLGGSTSPGFVDKQLAFLERLRTAKVQQNNT